MAECHCGMCEHCTPTLTQAFPAAKGHYATYAPELADFARVVAKEMLSLMGEFCHASYGEAKREAARRILELVGDE